MKKTLVLGIGSPFGADTTGWQVIDRLQTDYSSCRLLLDQAELRKEDRPGVGLIELLRPYARAILVDAVISGAPPGTLHHLTRDELPPSSARLSTHDAGIPEAIALGAALDALPEEIELYGIEVLPSVPADDRAIRALAERIAGDLGCPTKNAPLGGALTSGR